MQLAEWIEKPTIGRGSLKQLAWELAINDIECTVTAQEFGRMLTAAGWTRERVRAGRLWVAPGNAQVTPNEMRRRVVAAIRSHLRSVEACELQELRNTVAKMCGINPDGMPVQAVAYLAERGHLEMGETPRINGKNEYGKREVRLKQKRS